MNKKCCFDTEKGCSAHACYSREKCGSRDKNGNPKYMTLKEINDLEKRLTAPKAIKED